MANFITRTSLSRRALLRGIGAAVALPFLDAMVPAARATTPAVRAAEGPLRALWLFVPNGQSLPDWTPKNEGAGFDLPFILEPFVPYRADLSILSGLALDGAYEHGDGPGDHARGSAAFLTSMHPKKTGGADIRVGVSVDQLAAQKIGGATLFPSLELGCEPARQAGNCDSGYSCAYTTNISWRTPTSPNGKEVNPRAAFDRLFRTSSDGLTPEDAATAARARRSVLDSALDSARRLRATLGDADRARLDDYLASVRELETRIAKMESSTTAAIAEPPQAEPTDYQEHIRLMYDLVVAAFRTDRTRLATVMVANAGSNRSYRHIDVPEGHHDLSHHGNDPAKIAKIRKINRFHAEQVAWLLGRLRATQDGDKNLLDRAMVLYGCGIADGNRHDHHDLPILLAGHGNGTLKPGRHIRYPKMTPLGNLHLAMLDRLKVRVASFGDSTGHLEGI